MGNALRFLCGKCCGPTTGDVVELQGGVVELQGGSFEPHGVSSLAHDLFNFENTSLVPEELSNYVVSSRRAQVNWYRKLLEAWKQARPPPKTPEDVASLVIGTLAKHQQADVEGLLAFYGLPRDSIDVQTSLPEGVKFEMDTLPVDPRSVPDGDGLTVYVSTSDPRESSCVPMTVQVAAVQRSQARADRNYARAKELQQEIVDAGYRVIYLRDIKEEVLARKYRIRLRGIDAPENSMPYGKEAKEALVEIVRDKCLRVQVYGEDPYKRCVADVYCNGKFVQELMLKKGLAWHYTAYDKREEFARARVKRKGLWASSNPEKPWEWKRSHGNGGRNSVKAYDTHV